MHNEVITLADGITIYRGYTIERAAASNSLPHKGRYYITWLYRAGIQASFPNPEIAYMVVDALISQCSIAQCQCGRLVMASAETTAINHSLSRHRNQCGQWIERIA